MKFQIVVLFVFAALTLSASSEKSKGRISNPRNRDILGLGMDNSSKGRHFYKKGGSQTPQVYFISLGQTSGLDYTAPYSEIQDIEFDGIVDVEPVTSRAQYDDDDDDDDEALNSEIEAGNEQTSRRKKQRNSNLKLKKNTGKKQVASKKDGNKIRLIRLNDNSDVNSNSDNLGIRRLLFRQ